MTEFLFFFICVEENSIINCLRMKNLKVLNKGQKRYKAPKKETHM